MNTPDHVAAVLAKAEAGGAHGAGPRPARQVPGVRGRGRCGHRPRTGCQCRSRRSHPHPRRVGIEAAYFPNAVSPHATWEYGCQFGSPC